MVMVILHSDALVEEGFPQTKLLNEQIVLFALSALLPAEILQRHDFHRNSSITIVKKANSPHSAKQFY